MKRFPPGSSAAPLAKICGLRRPEDMIAACAAGADLIGLVFAPSRRRVSIDEARAIRDAGPEEVPAVGVFVDQDAGFVNLVAAEAGLDFVQLCGRESGAMAAQIQVPYLKVLHVQGDDHASVLQMMAEHRKAIAFIIDSPSPQGGGSGLLADWSAARDAITRSEKPVLLAGGLNPENVIAGLEATGAMGADVSSGVEVDGWKDAGRISAFVAAVRRAGTAPDNVRERTER